MSASFPSARQHPSYGGKAATGVEALLCLGTVHFHSLNSIAAVVIENKRKDYQKCSCAVVCTAVVHSHSLTRD